MSRALDCLLDKQRLADRARHDLQMHAFQVSIKRGSTVRCSFPVMGADSTTVAQQHEGMCEEGEYVSVKPAGTRS